MLKDLEEQRKKSEKEGNKFNEFNADIDNKIDKGDDKEGNDDVDVEDNK